ncbi:MAG: DinB family protein [Acidobacteriia bacterium]|nr:DinB family protein [Terriglobia bacterium]
MVRLDSVLNSWKTVREDTAQAVEDFSAHELDYKPTADLLSFGETARHILEAGHALAGLLLDGVDNMATPQFRQMLGKYTAEIPKTDGAGALARELRSRLDADAARLAQKSADFYAGEITRFDGQRVTRLEMLQMIKEHELTHRSQLFMYLRLKGIVPSTTRRRLAKANA